MDDQAQGAAEAQALKPIFILTRTSPDSNRLAILRVYPNRYFGLGWEKHADIPYYEGAPSRSARASAKRQALLEGAELSDDKASRFSDWPAPPETPQQFRDASSGWIATFDVYSLDKDPAAATITIKVLLGWPVVELCLRQGLCTDEKEWICAFPLSINPTFSMFTVLHKIICVDTADYFQQIVSLDWPSTKRWYSWSLMKHIGDKYSKAFRDDTYRYQLLWSPDGLYLLFFDRQLEPHTWTSTGTCAAVFAITTRTNGRKEAEMLNFFPSESFSTGIHSCQFHPTEALLVFRDEKRSYIWAFLKELKPRVLGLYGAEDTLSTRVDRLSFTACGKYLAVWYSGSKWPELYTLSDYLYRCLSVAPLGKYEVLTLSIFNTDTSGEGEGDADAEPEPVGWQTFSKPFTFYETEMGLALNLAGCLTSTDLVVTETRDGRIVMTTCKVTANEVQIIQKIGNQGARALLLVLPREIPRRDIEVQVQAPVSRDDAHRSKIIVNAGPAKVFLGRQSATAARCLPQVLPVEVLALQPLLPQEMGGRLYEPALTLTLSPILN